MTKPVKREGPGDLQFPCRFRYGPGAYCSEIVPPPGRYCPMHKVEERDRLAALKAKRETE